MNITSSTSISGMNAAQSLLQTSAQNIANRSITDLAPQNVVQSAMTQSEATLATDMVQQLQAKNSFLTNLSVFKTNNEMLGTLLDISA